MIGTIRGAITVKENNETLILEATEELLKTIMDINKINMNNVTSILFTATKDLTKVYPAVAARKLGFNIQSLLCFQEMYVENSLPLCIRVCMIVNEIDQQNAIHVYLREAKKLRPDLEKIN